MKKIILIIVTIATILSIASCDTQSYTSNSSNNSSNSKSNKNNSNVVEKIVYNTITFNTNGGSSIQSIKANELKSAPETSKKDHIFDGWFYDETLTKAVTFPMSIKKDTTIYARWLTVQSTQTCTGTAIKWDSDYSEAVVYQITPSGYDFNRLQEKGYRRIDVEVSYDVYYRQDYFGIGYIGSPKYEVSLYHSDKTGQYEEDLTTKTSSQTRKIKGSILISDISNDKLSLMFSTNNIQNVIYFENIVVTYTCVK